MTLVELSAMASLIAGAIGGGLAGSRAGFLAAAAGTIGGAFLAFFAALLAAIATGLVAAAFGGADDRPTRPLPGRLDALGFWALAAPMVSSPIWTSILAYRVVALFSGGG